jgi:predicted dehydrogenase
MVANEHLRAIRKTSGIKVVALCDMNEQNLTNMSRKWKVGAKYTDYGRMLEQEDLSIVSILTSPQFHIPLAIEAIKHGVNVLIEKPLTTSTKEAKLLLETLNDRSVKVTVDHLLLFTKVMIKASELMRSGAIGDVLGAKIDFLCTPDDPMTSTENHWCHKLPGGRLGEALPHPIYVAQSVVGELEVDRVLAAKRGRYPWMRFDELNVLLHGRNGKWADIYLSFNAPRNVIAVEVYGTRKILRMDLVNEVLIELGNRSIGKIASGKDILVQSNNLLLSTVKNTVHFLTFRTMEYPLRSLYSTFAASLTSGNEPPVTPRIAFETVAITEQVCKSIDNMKPAQ